MRNGTSYNAEEKKTTKDTKEHESNEQQGPDPNDQQLLVQRIHPRCLLRLARVEVGAAEMLPNRFQFRRMT